MDLECAIDHFLCCTACWTPCWFNKPKFHIIRHLPYHIERFGPTILFATKAFESFNTVIRAQSIHSNRLAPSRDIAIGFAHCSRVPHLVSGSWVDSNQGARMHDIPIKENLRQVGAGPQALLSTSSSCLNYVAKQLGLGQRTKTVPGQYSSQCKMNFTYFIHP